MSNTKRVLIILAQPLEEELVGSESIRTQATNFLEAAKERGFSVDVIDLYNDPDYGNYLDTSDTKILEYQIRFRRAETIFFFYPLSQLLPPALLKLFLENVLTSGFAFTKGKNPEPILVEKKSYCLAYTTQPSWKINLPLGNLHTEFWQKAIFEPTGIEGKCFTFGEINSWSEKQWDKNLKKISSLLPKSQTQNVNLIDLF